LVKGSGKREEEDITCKFKIGSMDTISKVWRSNKKFSV
jgi:hypothetical protein